MTIAEFIQRKKQEFFIAKDSDQMASQAAYLARERQSLEQERAVRQQVLSEQEAIKELRRQNNSDRLSILNRSTPERFFAMSQKANTFFHGDAMPGLREAHDRKVNILKPKGGIIDRFGGKE